MMRAMLDCGLQVESHHHEKASGGQCSIDVRYADLVTAADNVLKYKYIVKNVAHRHRQTATFMPKPLFDEHGSGMHLHTSLWKNGTNLFAGSGPSGLSELAEYAIGGILKHARALCAITNPTTNSYKRLVPGYEAPTRLAYSQRNRSAAVRIPVYSSRPRSRRIEYRLPDPSANPYLAFAAVLMAMLDGIKSKAHPGPPLDKDIYDLPPEELADVPSTPGHLDEALTALEADHEFLLHGGVFTEDVLDTWVSYKRKEEIEAIRLRPHPFEFALYYDS
jgi:glutamine synthetase